MCHLRKWLRLSRVFAACFIDGFSVVTCVRIDPTIFTTWCTIFSLILLIFFIDFPFKERNGFSSLRNVFPDGLHSRFTIQNQVCYLIIQIPKISHSGVNPRFLFKNYIAMVIASLIVVVIISSIYMLYIIISSFILFRQAISQLPDYREAYIRMFNVFIDEKFKKRLIVRQTHLQKISEGK